MFLGWFELSTEIAATNMLAQRVVALRLAKLAKGGPAAKREMRRMLVEKVVASAEAGIALASGRFPQSIVRRYQRIVRANEKRLDR
jgi:hypothetical protein